MYVLSIIWFDNKLHQHPHKYLDYHVIVNDN